MFEYVLIGVTCLISPIAFFILYCFIREGVKDELSYPISNCSVSMFEEIRNEAKQK